MSYPKTLEEAKAYRYDCWAGNPRGYAYKEGFCAHTVPTQNGWHFVQCSRKSGKGLNGLFCGIHTKKVKE